MRFGCCVAPEPGQIAILADAGYDFCELPAAAVVPFEGDEAALPVMRELERAPLRPESFNLLIPAALPLVGPHADHEALRVYLRRAFGRMARLGGEVAVLGSGAARRLPDDMPRDAALDQLVAAVWVAAAEAERAGITLALEHLNAQDCNVLTTVAECQRLIEERGLPPHVRLLADLYHLEEEREALRDVVAAGALLAHVHVAGGGRRAPHVPGYDYAGFMRVLHAVGYDRRISAECAWDDFAAEAPAALAFMREQWRTAQGATAEVIEGIHE